jgi:hypothetical protein
VDSFNGRLHDELLSSETFETLAEAKYPFDQRRLPYNHRRSQHALGKVAPAAFAANCAAAPPLRHCRAWGRGGLRCANSHNGWTDESNPVNPCHGYRHPV